MLYFLFSYRTSFSIIIDDFIDRENETHAFTKGTDLISVLRTGHIDIIPPKSVSDSFKTDVNYVYEIQRDSALRFNDISVFKFWTSDNKHLKNLTCSIEFSDSLNNTRWLRNIPLSTHKDIQLVPIAGYEDFLVDVNKPFLNNEITFMSIDYNAVAEEEESAGMYLSRVEAVPEPFSTLILGSGILNFIRGRNKRTLIKTTL